MKSEMSVNMQHIIADAKGLCNRMKDDETKSDTIISQSKNVIRQIQHIKQYSDDVELQNEAASQRSQSVLVAGLQRETQHMRELEAENRELRAAIDEYQNVLELIMSKYRQQVAKLMTDCSKDVQHFKDNPYSQLVVDQCNEIRDMREVMRRAAIMDEEETIKEKELLTQLATENKGLREMFNIYNKYGQQNVDPPDDQPERKIVDVAVEPLSVILPKIEPEEVNPGESETD